MDVKVGTFNLNNLFSRYNFQGEIEAIRAGETEVSSEATFVFSDPYDYLIRKYRGRLVKGKDPKETQVIAERIQAMNLDVLAVQEVEDIGVLRAFARTYLGGMYPYLALVEGNDSRLIDVGVLSKLPLGAVTSWQHAVHPDTPDEPIFSRDLLELEVYSPDRSKGLFTLYNTHLKSKYIPFAEDLEVMQRQNDLRRKRQAETLVRIIGARKQAGDPYLVCGDMNDTPEAAPLAPLAESPLSLVNALVDPEESRPAKKDQDGSVPSTTAWTHRFKEVNKPPRYDLLDHIWLSPALAGTSRQAGIERRSKHGGDGSDHDPAWVLLQLD